MATRMQQRRGTATEWSTANPVLGNGEIGFTTDTKVIKIGDGVTAWNSLAPISVDKARDADLLDGIDSTGYLLKGAVATTANAGVNTRAITSLNQSLRAGFYDGNNMTGAPDANWWHVLVMQHSNHTSWIRQIAYDLNAGTNRIMHRRCSSADPTLAASWTAWERIDAGAFLGVTAKAADSDLLDGIDSTGFVRSNIVTTAGDILVASGANTLTRLAKGANGQTLVVNASGNVAWETPSTDINSRVAKTGDTMTGRLVVSGQTGSDAFTSNGLEVSSTGTGVAARIIFHIPGVTAPQIGTDNNGLRTFDQPGTGFAPFRASDMEVTSNLPKIIYRDLDNGVTRALRLNGDVFEFVNKENTRVVAHIYNDGGITGTLYDNNGGGQNHRVYSLHNPPPASGGMKSVQRINVDDTYIPNAGSLNYTIAAVNTGKTFVVVNGSSLSDGGYPSTFRVGLTTPTNVAVTTTYASQRFAGTIEVVEFF